ncbi:MAG: hypothetical protein IMZ52_02885 [Actinobacteria bacterium]|nr:hypothetical protein [Actinomycetota bacterium]MBE3114891.1 hypothetical protein [Actinomycetota bacterium]
MPKLSYNAVEGILDYISKNSDFAISGLKDISYIYPTDGDVLTWNSSLGKWSSQAVTSSPNLDGGLSNSNYSGTTTIDGGTS